MTFHQAPAPQWCPFVNANSFFQPLNSNQPGHHVSYCQQECMMSPSLFHWQPDILSMALTASSRQQLTLPLSRKAALFKSQPPMTDA